MAGIRAHGEVFMVVYDSKITAMSAPGGMVHTYADWKCETVLVAAKALAPKRSGRLAGGIRKDVRQTSRDRGCTRGRAPRSCRSTVRTCGCQRSSVLPTG
jgi:hypothetical protein